MKNKKLNILIGLLVILLVIGTGISFAYLSVTGKQEFANIMKTACLEITLESESDAISLEKAYPITDEEGKNLTPYTFTIKNTCSTSIDYSINLEILNISTLSAEYVRGALDLNEAKIISEFSKVKTTLENAKESYQLEEGILGGGEILTRGFRMWIDYDATKEQAANKTMQNKIVVTATLRDYTCMAAGITNFSDCLIATEYSTSNVEFAKNKIKAKPKPDFSKIAPTILYEEAPNDHKSTLTSPITAYIGTSYTFDENTGRYTVTNYSLKNYIEISNEEYTNNNYYTCSSSVVWNANENKYSESRTTTCPHLYKINSASSYIEYDDNLKQNVTYYKAQASTSIAKAADNSHSDNGMFSKEDDLGMSYYYRGEINNNNVYFAGYYWKVIRINGDGSIRLIYNGSTAQKKGLSPKSGTYNSTSNMPLYVGYMYNEDGTTYEEVNRNITSSAIKQKVDTWYVEHIKNTEYESYLADSGFCNDRSIAKSSDGTGIEINVRTLYGAYERLRTNKSPILTCPQKNDNFTLKVEKGGKVGFGNNALDYPIGLITADETSLAGAVNSKTNSLIYLNASGNYYTMTPYDFYDKSNVFYYNEVYGASALETNIPNGIRPVINIKSTVKVVDGTGTLSEPYKLSL